MLFDPIKFRETGQDYTLRSLLNLKFDESKPMGNFLIYELDAIIKLILVGAYAQIAPVVPRFLEWLQMAIDRDEEFGADKDFYYQGLHWAEANYLWLLNNEHSQEVWGRAQVHSEVVVRKQRSSVNKNNAMLTLDDYMALCVASKRYDQGILEFEEFLGAQAISLKKSLKPREFGYAICLHHAASAFSKADLRTAGEKMLRCHLQEVWLGGGQYARAATWLKIIYWDTQLVANPVDAILKAYDNMPKVLRPDIV